MKPHPRIRKTIKWGGAAVPTLTGAVWIGGGWAEFGTRPAGDRYIIPMWPVPVLSLRVTISAWHHDARALRRARLNLCPTCNYDRAGLSRGAVVP